MKTKGKKKWIAAIALIVALVGGYIFITFSGGVEVDTVTVDKGAVQKLIKEIGTVESENLVVVSSNFSGEVEGLSTSIGASVNLGDLLLTSDKGVSNLDLKSLKAQLSGLEISHKRARDITNRNKSLYDQGAASREEYEAALASERELEAQISSLKYSIESFAKSSETKGITSPITGTVTEVFVKEGEYVTVGTPLFEIADLKQLYIGVKLIEDDADLVEAGDSVLIYMKSNKDLPVTGRVRRIHLKSKEEVSGLGIIQKRVGVEIEIDTDIILRLGSDIELAIIVSEKETVLRVPIDSVFQLDGDFYVYVVDDGRARLRIIEKGLEGDEYVEIVSGLKTADKVILSPGNDIDDGTRLK